MLDRRLHWFVMLDWRRKAIMLSKTRMLEETYLLDYSNKRRDHKLFFLMQYTRATSSRGLLFFILLAFHCFPYMSPALFRTGPHTKIEVQCKAIGI